ncbi:hypothetical protein ABZP36_000446 [Zizania latifolia]
MASEMPSQVAGGGEGTTPAPSVAAALPLDALFEILLRLPAREICRLRAVCRSWRALASDRLFIDAHAACHPGPFVASSFVDDGGDESCGVSIIDLSTGDVVKRIHPSVRDFRVQRTRLDLVCLVEGPHPLAVTVLNPATGATCSSAKYISDDYEHFLKLGHVSMDSCAFGKVPSTGEYKAFRFLHVDRHIDIRQQLCEVMTLGSSGLSQWRAKQGPPVPVCLRHKMKSVVINGVVYFLFDFLSPLRKHVGTDIKPGSIVPFNLETEEWMDSLNGPKPVTQFYKKQNVIIVSNYEIGEHLSLTDLNGSLVTVHTVFGCRMDFWFLSDFEKGPWVKKYSICQRYNDFCAYPLLLLGDERIVFIMQMSEMLQSYDPKEDTYIDILELENFRSVGIYTGNLLSLESGFN